MNSEHLSVRRFAAFFSALLVIASVGEPARAAFNSDAALAIDRDAQTPKSVDATVPQILRSIIAKTLKIAENKVTATATFVKDLGADELALVELVMAYEREFKVRISDAEADQFRQVRDVVTFLRKRGALK